MFSVLAHRTEDKALVFTKRPVYSGLCVCVAPGLQVEFVRVVFA